MENVFSRQKSTPIVGNYIPVLSEQMNNINMLYCVSTCQYNAEGKINTLIVSNIER